MDLGLFVLRIVVGLLFVGHGTQKLYGWFGGHGVAGTGKFFESLGMKPGQQQARMAGLSEAVGGALIALGLLMPVGTVLIVAVMFTAIFTAHREKGLWVTEGGFEYNVVLIAAVVALAGAGPGDWALSNMFGLDDHSTGWAVFALLAGFVGSQAAIAYGRSQSEERTPAKAPASRARPREPLTH